MVDIVSHANVAAEHDPVLNKRPQSSSSASSTPANPAHLSQNSQAETVPPPIGGSDVRLEITKLKNITGYVYKIIDKKSGDVVRQWPTEQMIEMRQYLAEQQIQLIDEKA
ncbi:MAG TPA: flagellar protein FlaG [Rhizomicrobium sp.]|nr:flagellar protein FlaG [Rhizomicrobium sp.]